MLMLAAAFYALRYNKPVLMSANTADTSGSHTGPISYIAGEDLVVNRLVQFADPADPHDRTVEYADGTGIVIGVTLGSSDTGEAVAVHVFGATPGTVKIETTGDIDRLDQISPAADGIGIVAGDGAALSADVVAVAMEGNDLNDEVECVGNAAPLFA